MPKQLGRVACEQYLNSREEKSISTKSIMSLLDLCLDNNYFEFNDKTYIQKEGVPIGPCMAPPYACLGMGDFEKECFKAPTFIDTFQHKLQFWRRFIDDILTLFRGNEEEAKQFVDFLNSLFPGIIEFTFEYSRSKIVFLDVELSFQHGRVETSLHIKPTNLQMFLDWNSNHPFHCKVAIIYSQALRVNMICSDPGDRQLFLESLRNKFIQSNYPVNHIQEQFERAMKVNRADLIWRVKGKNKRKFRAPFIHTHNEYGPPWRRWYNKYKHILELDPKFQVILKDVRFVTKQPKNLQNMLCSAKIRNATEQRAEEQNPGTFRCGKTCHVCPRIKEGARFQSTNTGRSYKARVKCDCKSKLIIYLVTWLRCAGQYVGMTTNGLAIRHSTHKQRIKQGLEGIGGHYKVCGLENFSVQVIDQVRDWESMDKTVAENSMKKLEEKWQHQLKVFEENGGNAHCRKREKAYKKK